MAQPTPANGNTQFLNEEQHKHEDPPIVDMDALTQSFSSSSTGRRPSSADPQKKIKAQNSIIQKLQQAQLLTTRDALEESTHNNAELNALLRATMNSPGPERAQLETPGLHRLQPRAPRPEDVEYLENFNFNKNMSKTKPPKLNPTQTMS